MFRIIYQNGEFYSKASTFMGISIDAIFTVSVTIVIFVLGYIVTQIIEQRKERNRLHELEDYFRKLVEMLEKPLQVQKKSFLDFAKALKEDKEQHYEVADVAAFKLTYINQIDSKDLYTIFIRSKKGETAFKTELYGRLRASLDYFEIIKQNLPGTIKAFMQKHEEYTSIYKRNIALLNETLDNIVINLNRQKIPPLQFPILESINNIRFFWIEKESNENYRDIYVSFENFIQPVQQLVKQNQKEHGIEFIVNPLMECVYAYDNLKELKSFYRKHFTVDARELQKHMFRIKQILQELR
jgi:hypothetical protein